MHISQQIAALAVTKVLGGRNLTLALPEAIKAFPKASPQQRGGGADLSYGTLRYYGEVRACLDQLLEKPLTHQQIEALLLVAIYQLRHDEAKDFTVVNEAVKAASYAKPRWAKGLVNGVLRNFLRQQDTLLKRIKKDEVAQYSYPKWWIEHLKSQYPENWQAMLKAGQQHPPMTLRVNQRQTTAQAYAQLLERQGLAVSHIGQDAVKLAQPIAIDKVPGFSDGVVSVQDYGAQLAARLLDVREGMHVLDACSAPGGKTCHILELASVALTALDSDASRLERVAENLQRLQLEARLITADAASWQSDTTFDRILADVPCTASGIVRRHVDIKWLRRKADIVSFTQQQQQILSNLWQLLAKGGKLLYVTCSVFAEENQQQIDRFLQQHADAVQLQVELTGDEEFVGHEAITDDALKHLNIRQGQLIPSENHDGFFYAILQKN